MNSQNIWRAWVCPLSFALLLYFVVLPPAAAQYSETTGVIQGTVKDPTAAVVPKASVELSSIALITAKKIETDSSGYFRFVNLPPGNYSLLVTAQGFSQQNRTEIKLEVGKVLTIDVTLEVGAVTQTVVVESAPLQIDTTSNKAAVNFTSEQITNMPKGRSAFLMLGLAPGARFEPLQGSVRGDARGVDAGFQIDGASDGENVYALEGMDTTNIRTGGIGVNPPSDFVQEVQVKSSGMEAEYGGALGGVVNIVEKRGGSTWHGAGLLYYRSDVLQASERVTLRLNPTYPLQTGIRLSEPAENYQPKEDRWKLLEPGFEAGGFVLRDRLWFYGSYIPSMFRQTRTVFVNFVPAAPQSPFTGPRDFPTTDTTHYALGRLDWQAARKVRASFGWHYAYRRATGQSVPRTDSPFFDPNAPDLDPSLSGTQRNQFNPDSTRDPGTFRADTGFVAPNSTYTVNADWTISPKFVVTGRYGYWFTNRGDRGRPVGVRREYILATAGVTGLDGSAIPAGVQGPADFSNIPSNSQTIFDVLTRHGLNVDASYVFRAGGTHTFKGGYAFNRLANDVQNAFNTAWVRIYWGQDRTSSVITGAGQAFCAPTGANRTRNRTLYGMDVCQGIYGAYLVGVSTETTGKVSSFNNSLYVQDTWQVGRGITLNLGVRFDKEYLPSFKPYPNDPLASRPIDFGFGSKVGPRLGGAWDVFRNGKMKVYGSWGFFYDIMKYEMPRGAFGGEYWHDCWFTLDTTDLSTINPQRDAGGHSCPGAGGTPGDKIEEIDWRAVANDPSDNRIPADTKPMRQRELVFGAEYALRSDLGLEVRYARKRLDRTIEDTGYFDALGENYYIGNPGEGILVNPVSGVCPTCPNQPKPMRNYDGVEFKLSKRWSHNFFFTTSYTYSRLYGNYSGLTSTDEVGRHSPNVNRFFDLPHMAWNAQGQQVFGLLPTDRPHTFKFYGAYRLKWWGMESTFGLTQVAYSGTPLTTEIGTIGSLTSSSPVEGRGNFVPLSRDPATGNWIAGGIEKGKRTDAFTNTDFLYVHEFKLSKTNEALRAAFELNVSNLLNQSNVLSIYFRGPRTGVLTFPITGSAIPDWAAFFAGFDWVAKANAQSKVMDSRYGTSQYFQVPRSLRMKIKFSF